MRVFKRLYPFLLGVALVSCGSLVHHRVEKGDTLYSIGFYYGQDYKDIAKWNNIEEPYSISVGQWLRVAPPNKEWWEEEKQKNNKAAPASKSKITRPVANTKKNSRLATRRVVVADPEAGRVPPIKKWIWPTRGKLVQDKQNRSASRNGINIEGNRGQPIVAAASGRVVYSGSGLVGYGNLIIIKHNKTYLSAYAHNQTMLVKEGETVRQGQKIALMGKTRDNRVQLHFEIRKNGKPVDPLRLLDKRSH